MFLARFFTIFFLAMESLMGAELPEFDEDALRSDWNHYHNMSPPTPERRLGVDPSLTIPLVSGSSSFPHWNRPPPPPKKKEPAPPVLVPVHSQATTSEAIALSKPLPKDRKKAEMLLLEELKVLQLLSNNNEKRIIRKNDKICDEKSQASREEICNYAKKVKVNRFVRDDVIRNNECILEQANIMQAPKMVIKLDVLHCQNSLMIASGSTDKCFYYLERDRNGARPDFVKIMSHTCDNQVDVSSSSESDTEEKKLNKKRSSPSKEGSHGRKEKSSPGSSTSNRHQSSSPSSAHHQSYSSVPPRSSSPNNTPVSTRSSSPIVTSVPARSSSPIATSVPTRSSSPIDTAVPTRSSSPNAQTTRPSPGGIPSPNLRNSSPNLPNIASPIHHKSPSHNLQPTSIQPSLHSPNPEHIPFSPSRVSSPVQPTPPSLSRLAPLAPPSLSSVSLLSNRKNFPDQEHIISSPAHISSPVPMHVPSPVLSRFTSSDPPSLTSPSSRKNARENSKKSENVSSKKIRSAYKKKECAASKIGEVSKKSKTTNNSLSKEVAKLDEKHKMSSEIKEVKKPESKNSEGIKPGERATKGKSRLQKFDDFEFDLDAFDDSFGSQDDPDYLKSKNKSAKKKNPEKKSVKNTSKSKTKKVETSDDIIALDSNPFDKPFKSGTNFTKSIAKGKRSKDAGKIKATTNIDKSKSNKIENTDDDSNFDPFADPSKNDDEEDYKVAGIWMGGKFYKPGDVIPGVKKPGDKSKIITSLNTGSTAEKRKLDKEIKVDKGGRNKKAGKFEKLDLPEEAKRSTKPETSDRNKSKIIPKPVISDDPDLTPSSPSSSRKIISQGKFTKTRKPPSDSDYIPSSPSTSHGITTSPSIVEKPSSSESSDYTPSSPSMSRGRGRAKSGRGHRAGTASATRGRGSGRGRGRGASSKVIKVESSDEEYIPRQRSPSDTIAKTRKLKNN